MFTPLYKLDSKGKVREWNIEIHTYPSIPKYIIIHGLKDGKQQKKMQEVPYGKNIGKANETTAQEQCILEAQSKWNNQKDRKGYSVEIPTKKRFGPMLAKSYAKTGSDITDLKDGKHIEFPCYYQPKLDGVRCLASWEDGKVVLRSRKHTKQSVLPHIEKELFDILYDNQDVILDGELYVHGWDFQRLISAIKRDDANNESEKIEYHVYDYYNKNKPDTQFSTRYEILMDMLYDRGSCIKRVVARVLEKDRLEEVLEYTIRYGYEGIMLRNKKGPYKVDGRSKDLQKVKLFIDAEFEIFDAVENLHVPGTCSFWCRTEEGYPFKATPKGTAEQREQYWHDWQHGVIHKGNQLTCRFFSWTTSEQPVPRFPIGVAIRDYE